MSKEMNDKVVDLNEKEVKEVNAEEAKEEKAKKKGFDPKAALKKAGSVVLTGGKAVVKTAGVAFVTGAGVMAGALAMAAIVGNGDKNTDSEKAEDTTSSESTDNVIPFTPDTTSSEETTTDVQSDVQVTEF